VLQTIGAWEGLERRGVNPIEAIQVLDDDSPATIRFEASDADLPHLGVLAHNQAIVDALHEALLGASRVRVYRNAAPRDLVDEGARAAVTIDDNGATVRLVAKVAIAADGRDSGIREQLGIATLGHDYHQSGVVATIKPEYPHRNMAWQRFLPTGPLAFLPLTENRCSIVWTLPTEQAREVCALDDEAFRATLGRAFGPDLGRIVEAGPRFAFPFKLAHAHRYGRGRIWLAGDAAHAVHPLAGLGYNLAVRDVAWLAQVLVEASYARQDIGGARALKRYESGRMPDSVLTSAYVDSFNFLFSTEDPVRQTLRRSAIAAVNMVGPLRRLMMREGMGMGVFGLAGPRLLRGEGLR